MGARSLNVEPGPGASVCVCTVAPIPRSQQKISSAWITHAPAQSQAASPGDHQRVVKRRSCTGKTLSSDTLTWKFRNQTCSVRQQNAFPVDLTNSLSVCLIISLQWPWIMMYCAGSKELSTCTGTGPKQTLNPTGNPGRP
eukprot:3341936-Rhodomonas_salina.4